MHTRIVLVVPDFSLILVWNRLGTIEHALKHRRTVLKTDFDFREAKLGDMLPSEIVSQILSMSN